MRIAITEFIINPPPREDLSLFQKLWRILSVALLLIGACVMAAFVGAILLEAYQHL